MNLRHLLQAKIFIAPIFLVGFSGFAYSQDLQKIPSAQETPAARALVRLDEVDAQIRTLTDRIERLEADLSAQKTENQRLAKLIDENNAKLIASQKAEEATPIKEAAASAPNIGATPNESTIAPATKPISEPAIKPLAVSAPAPSSTKATIPDSKVAAATPVAKPSASPVAKSTSAPIPAKKPTISAAQYLNLARLDIQNGELEDAAKNLKSLIENYNSGTEQLEARWLLGETYFVQNEFLEATKVYIDYLKVDKNGPRVPDVLVRLASSYRELGVTDQRCKALKAYQTLAKNPSAALKARAQDELAKGSCP